MPTFQTLQDRVSRRVVDLPAAVVTEVPDLVNKALTELQEHHDFKIMEATTAQLTTTAAARTLSAVVPTDMKGLRGRPYLVMFDGSTRDLLMAPHLAAALDAYTFDDADDKGEPRLILDPHPSDETGARTWEVWPYPDGLSDWSDGEYRIVVPYWKYLTALSAGADENWFTSNATWYLVFKATAEAFYLDWDEDRGQIWETRAQGELTKALKRDKLARLGSVRQLSLSLDVFGPQLRS